MEITENEYQNHCKNYDVLGSNLEDSLKILLDDVGISYLDVKYRIKEYKSFIDKVSRKGYEDPLTQNEDFCGLRIICYFPSDIEKIASIINNEFIVHSSENKSEREIDRFGYRSYHFIVSIKDTWASTPSFRRLESLKVEIQIRTILMHAWADIEHKLQYKKKEHIPKTIQRKFYQMSAIFELADEQFEVIREQKEKIYLKSLSNNRENFDVNQDMNADTLQAFLDLYVPNRDKSQEQTVNLLDELLAFNIDFNYLSALFNTYTTNDILKIEKDYQNQGFSWSQVGVIRFLLDMNHKMYYESRSKIQSTSRKEIYENHRKG